MIRHSAQSSFLQLILFLVVFLLNYSLLYAQDENLKSIYKNSSTTSQASNSSSEPEKQFDIDLSVYINFRRNRKLQSTSYEDFEYTTYTGGPLRFRNSANIEYWVKIVRPNNASLNNNQLLVVKPNTLDAINLYIPAIVIARPIESVKPNTVNTLGKYSKRAHVFELPETPDYKVAYLHIKSKTNTQFDIELWNSDEYYKEDARFNSLLSMLYGVLLLAIVINLLFFIALRQNKYLIYCVYVFGLLTVLATASGKIFEYNFAAYLATSANKILLLKALSAILLVLLIQTLTNLKTKAIGLFKLSEGLKLFFAVIMGICFALETVPAFIETLFSSAIILLVLMCLFIPLISWQSEKRDIHYVFYSIIPIAIAFIIASLTGIESLPKNIYTQTAMQLGFVLHALIISLGLSSNVFDLKKQLLKVQETNRQHSLSLEIEKQHADLINHVKSYIRFNPEADQEHEIVSRFFEQLRPLYTFEKASLIYQIDSKLIIKADFKKYQPHFTDLVNDNLIEITRLCHGNKISEIKPKNMSGYFDKKTKFLVIPVFLRGQEWSGMLINLKDDQVYSEEQKDSLHRYATEVVRSLLNIQMINDIRSELKEDPISKLLNRAAVFEELDLLIKDTQYSDKPSSIALLKVSGYIHINEDHGHEIAQSLLRYIGDHLKASFDENVLIGRTANADFLLLFKDSSAGEASKYLKKMRTQLKPMAIKDTQINIQLYLAVAQCYGAFETSREIMRRVDKGIQAAQLGESDLINIQE